MSQPSPNYCNKVERWILGGVPLERMNMRPDQKFRAHLVTEVYHSWIDSPTINPRKMLANFARRDYAFLLRKAATDNPDDPTVQEARDMVEAMHLTESSVRSANELSNDIYLLNYLIGKLSTSKKHIHRIMVESDIDWLRDFGRETGTWQAVNKAADKLMKLENDFKEEENPADHLDVAAGFDITDDVSVVNAARQNYTPEEIAKYEKKYGISKKESAILMEEQDGVYVPAEPDLDDEPVQDIFMEDD